MLGILFIYLIGKYFFNLALRFNRNKWGFAILGVLSYYVSSFLGVFLTIMVMEQTNPDTLAKTDELVFSFLSLPFGFAGCFLLYKLLERQWREVSLVQSEILDQMEEIS
ncbi:MAG: hypothetical protein LPK80_12575 [Bacteroidota bacterium]|nr:hypothetical protein [Bacteroidota bacterium]MDX5427761.1 hypothetical protein [Bacteroidota bacterium]MDX5448353.1 hypothetical protein [Bacteroidota bacterium]MDX5505644.1 hypothetical protein [Bacteroidota bacterium]